MTTRAELSAAEAYGHGDTPLMRAALDGDTESVRELNQSRGGHKPERTIAAGQR